MPSRDRVRDADTLSCTEHLRARRADDQAIDAQLTTPRRRHCTGSSLVAAGRRRSQKWEPTQSAASGLSPTTQNVRPGQGLPVRLSPTMTDTRNALGFPDTEEVTGSNPVRPTAFSKTCLTPRAGWELATCGSGASLLVRAPHIASLSMNQTTSGTHSSVKLRVTRALSDVS